MNNNKNNIEPGSKKAHFPMTVIVVLLILVVAVGIGGYIALSQNKKAVTSSKSDFTSTESEDDSNTITYNGEKYIKNSNIQTVLFLGIDKSEKAILSTAAGSNGQADCIILMVMDKSTKETTLLQISRETMVDIDVYGADGDYYNTEKAQLALQYAYGDGDTKSIWLMKKAVSTLLGGIPIDSALALNMNGIASITDALGGVEITIPEDYTVIDPAYTAGASVTLNGSQAERYVRYRDTAVSGSNTDRMKSQNQFIPALVAQAKTAISSNSTMYDQLMAAAKPYMISDLGGEELRALASYEVNAEPVAVPGEVVAGEQHDEFYVNSDEFQSIIVKMFYKKS